MDGLRYRVSSDVNDTGTCRAIGSVTQAGSRHVRAARISWFTYFNEPKIAAGRRECHA
jgi:hypothetical protein